MSKTKPERAPWTQAEDMLLASLTMYGTGPVLIGKVLNRTTRAVRYRRDTLGIAAPKTCRRDGCDKPMAKAARKGPGRTPELCDDHRRIRPAKREQEQVPVLGLAV